MPKFRRDTVRGRAIRASRKAREYAMVRPLAEWLSDGTCKPGELAAFLDQVEGLLTSSDESKSNFQ